MFFSFRALLNYAALSLLFTTSSLAQSLQLQVTCADNGVALDCSRFITTFCTQTGTGAYSANDNVARCFNSDGNKCDLTAWYNRVSVATAIPSVTNCINALNTVMASCPMGGSGEYTTGSFMFTIDPNRGQCGDDEANGNPS